MLLTGKGIGEKPIVSHCIDCNALTSLLLQMLNDNEQRIKIKWNTCSGVVLIISTVNAQVWKMQWPYS